MNVTELISALEEERAAHGDVRVFATWEGVVRALERRSVYLDDAEESGEHVLLIDADENRYEQYFRDAACRHGIDNVPA